MGPICKMCRFGVFWGKNWKKWVLFWEKNPKHGCLFLEKIPLNMVDMGLELQAAHPRPIQIWVPRPQTYSIIIGVLHTGT